MSTANQNLRFLRKKYQFTQEDMAEKLGIKRSLLGAYEEARANPRLDVLVKASEIFNVSVDQILSQSLHNTDVGTFAPDTDVSVGENKIPAKLLKREDYLKQYISENSEEKKYPTIGSVQRLRLVPKTEYKRYFYQAVDHNYVNQLTEIQLPLLPPATRGYRAFEVTDDSMLPVAQGSIVVGKRVEDIQRLSDGKDYILVTRTEGIIFRRVYNQIAKSGKLLLEALNPKYPRKELSVMGREVEVWEIVLYLNTNLPQGASQPVDSNPEVSRLAQMVYDLQEEVQQIKRQL